MALYSVATNQPPAAADLNQIVNLLSGNTAPALASVSVANRVRASLTGATATSGLVGTTSGGSPTSGTFATGDLVVDTVFSCLWVCTAGGTPGTWSKVGGGQVWGTSAWMSTGVYVGPVIGPAPPPAVSQLLATRSGRSGFDVLQTNYGFPDTVPFGIPGFNQSAFGYNIPLAGTYLLYARAECNGPTAGTDLALMVLKNGQPWQFGTQFRCYGAPVMKLAMIIPCAVNDLIQLAAYAEGGYSPSPTPTSILPTTVMDLLYLGN